MATYAVLDVNNYVTNIIIAEDLETAEEATESTCVEYTSEDSVSIGWLWDGVSFVNPNPPVEEEPVEEEPIE